MLKILGEKNSILNKFICELRNVEVQNDRMRFRRNLERISEIFAYELSQQLNYSAKQIQTPLGTTDIPLPTDKIVVASILRAGLPMHQGLLNYFDDAENAFISAYRKYSKDGSFKIQFEHLSCPNIKGKVLIIADPMLATGSSMILAYKALLEKGKPKHTHIVSIVASKEGVEYTRQNLTSKDVTLWLGAVDDELTVKSYIVPGLGDAGDLAYGGKE
ncbi:MAG: uracil phosphoribosyltransferase [Bacteroidales bacterium]|nr:uracil phosphoribosyltransferase [Bacteroidales bacterium]MDD3891876.1 uracil phosphoribosyltransferase [Bacteroidales bacterium]